MATLLPPVLGDLVMDQLALVQNAIEVKNVPVDLLINWRPAPEKGDVCCRRTLAMISAYHGCVEVMAYLLQKGCNPNLASPDDGATALHCAAEGGSPKAPKIIELLLLFGADREAVDLYGRRPIDVLLSNQPCVGAHAVDAEDDGDLDKEEYRTDEFRMYHFKVDKCTKIRAHDWTECPFAHPGEKARRRDPRLFIYGGTACPDFRKSTCKRGDDCTYSHGVFESWLHPTRYRTELCKDGEACKRRVCFFAHNPEEQRQVPESTSPTACETPAKAAGIDEACLQPASPGSSHSSGTGEDAVSLWPSLGKHVVGFGTSEDGSAASNLKSECDLGILSLGTLSGSLDSSDGEGGVWVPVDLKCLELSGRRVVDARLMTLDASQHGAANSKAAKPKAVTPGRRNKSSKGMLAAVPGAPARGSKQRLDALHSSDSRGAPQYAVGPLGDTPSIVALNAQLMANLSATAVLQQQQEQLRQQLLMVTAAAQTGRLGFGAGPFGIGGMSALY